MIVSFFEKHSSAGIILQGDVRKDIQEPNDHHDHRHNNGHSLHNNIREDLNQVIYNTN